MVINNSVSDAENYIELIKNTLSEYRFHHSMCVAEKARELAVKYKLDADKAYLAGVLHDVTKEMDYAEQIKLIEENERKLTFVELGNKRVLHQMSGAAYVKDVLKINDEEIVGAIRYHSTGKAEMTPFEMIVYLADFTSADRSYPDVEIMREKTEEGLFEGMLYSLRHTIISVAGENRLLHPDTVNCYNWVLSKLN